MNKRDIKSTLARVAITPAIALGILMACNGNPQDKKFLAAQRASQRDAAAAYDKYCARVDSIAELAYQFSADVYEKYNGDSLVRVQRGTSERVHKFVRQDMTGSRAYESGFRKIYSTWTQAERDEFVRLVRWADLRARVPSKYVSDMFDIFAETWDGRLMSDIQHELTHAAPGTSKYIKITYYCDGDFTFLLDRNLAQKIMDTMVNAAAQTQSKMVFVDSPYTRNSGTISVDTANVIVRDACIDDVRNYTSAQRKLRKMEEEGQSRDKEFADLWRRAQQEYSDSMTAIDARLKRIRDQIYQK